MQKPKISKDVEFDNKNVFDPFSGSEIQINEITAKILGLCDGTRTTAEIAEEIASKYDVEVSEALSDIEEVVESLEELKMLDTKDRIIRKFAAWYNQLWKKILMKFMGV